VVFEQVVRIIGELFAVRVVCLSEIVGQELYFTAVYRDGQVLRNAGHCTLAITPCATVEQTKDLRMFDRVMERFPQASFLQYHQAVSYCGFPSLDNNGNVIAVTCLLDDKPHEFTEEEQSLLRILGQRISTEIERSRSFTQQKEAESKLQQSQAFIRQVIDTDPNFIFVKDRDGRFTLANKAVADAYGTTVDALIGKTDADFNAHCDEVEVLRQKDLEVLDTLQERFIAEGLITDARGRPRWLQTVKRPLPNDQGRAIMVVGASTDITARKKTEEALVASKKRLQDVLDGLLGFVGLYSLEGRIVEVNRAPLEAGGVSKEDVIGRLFWETPWWSDLPDMQQRLQEWMRRAAQGEVIRGELQFRVRGGQTAIADVTFGPLRDAAGNIIHILGFGVDITERKRMEDKLCQQAHHLRHAFNERERISQDLHDGILQSLFGVGLALETVKSMLPPGSRKSSSLLLA